MNYEQIFLELTNHKRIKSSVGGCLALRICTLFYGLNFYVLGLCS
jgi:hypothetical protein